jgi:hypothetical protein
MDTVRACASCALSALVLLIAACAKEAPDEMSWGRAALERNPQLEVVAADPKTNTFIVRVRDTGALSTVRADQLIASVGAPTAPAAPAKGDTAAAEAPAATGNGTMAQAGEPAVPAVPATEEARAAEEARASAPEPAPLAAADSGGGRVLKSGPGYSIKAATPSAPVANGRVRDSAVTSAAVERRHEPIVCQGARLLHIDNRNLEFDGDAVSAEDGCEVHITNSHISATGVGVTARAANVHIDNSLIEGESASIDASGGAQVYAASSRFRGLSRREDTAAFHDLGGNIWN